MHLSELKYHAADFVRMLPRQTKSNLYFSLLLNELYSFIYIWFTLWFTIYYAVHNIAPLAHCKSNK